MSLPRRVQVSMPWLLFSQQIEPHCNTYRGDIGLPQSNLDALTTPRSHLTLFTIDYLGNRPVSVFDAHSSICPHDIAFSFIMFSVNLYSPREWLTHSSVSKASSLRGLWCLSDIPAAAQD